MVTKQYTNSNIHAAPYQAGFFPFINLTWIRERIVQQLNYYDVSWLGLNVHVGHQSS